MTPGYVLDSDVTSLLAHYPTQHLRLARKVSTTPTEQIWISIVTIEEALQGAFALINNPRTPESQMQSCELLRRIMREYARFRILPYDEEARQVYKTMTAAEKRVGANDCKRETRRRKRLQDCGDCYIAGNDSRYAQREGFCSDTWRDVRKLDDALANTSRCNQT